MTTMALAADLGLSAGVGELGVEKPLAAQFQGILRSATVLWKAATRGRQNPRQLLAGGGWKKEPLESSWSRVQPELRASGY